MRLLLLGAMGGLQGAIGWWMVSSGLKEGMTDVASYRLATHLGLAFVIFGFITWFMMQLSRRDADLLQDRRMGDAGLTRLASWLVVLAFVQILIGALVAGIDAGRNYPDWPLMAGGFLPPDLFSLTPWWRNFFEDDGLVQFIHRTSAYLLFVFGIVVGLRAKYSAHKLTRSAFNKVVLLLVIQMVLGIITVLNSSPWYLAILHQFGAVVLWVVILRARFIAQYPHPQFIQGV